MCPECVQIAPKMRPKCAQNASKMRPLFTIIHITHLIYFQNASSASKNTIILQQGQGGTLQVVSAPTGSSNSVNSVSTGQNSNQQTPSIPFLSLGNSLPQAHKPLGSKICRWVNNDGTVCGKAFSKLDSLRRYVNQHNMTVQ